MATKKAATPVAAPKAKPKVFKRGVYHRGTEAKTPIEAPLDAKPVPANSTFVPDQGTPEDAAKQGAQSLFQRAVKTLITKREVPETTAE